MNIYEAHQKLLKKEISSLELTKEAVKIANENKHNAFISITEDLALEQATKADSEISSGDIKSYLHGLPYSLKDLFVTKNIRTTGGSKILYNYIPPYDGYVSSSLTNAGGILIGKVGCDEFGMGSTNEYTPYGVVKNPVNIKKVPGGSSGGSASSVAEGSSFYSFGTDTGGSSRQPANFCGLVGYKPTYGRVSRYGQIAYASSLDQAAPLAKSVLDIACVLSEVTSKDIRDATQPSLDSLNCVEELVSIKPDYLKGKKIAFTPQFIENCSPLVKEKLKASLDLFKKAGANLIEVDMPYLDKCVSAYYIIATSEASSNLARYDGIHFGHRSKVQGDLEATYVNSRSEGFGEEVKRRILLGTFALSSGYYDAYYAKACKVRRLIYESFQNAFKQCDVFFSPVSSTVAYNFNEGIKDPVQMYMNDLFTIPVNLAGLPSLAIPFEKAEENMPTGFQLIANNYEDQKLLEFGHSFELLK